MNKLWIAVFLASAVTAAGAQNKTNAQSQNSTNHPRRVRMQVSGFDLAPQAASANQIGGASRGVTNSKPVALYAPHKGLLYTLHPNFWWQGDAHATYKFHLQGINGGSSWTRPVTGTSLDYPMDAPALEPGKTYTWGIASEASLFGPPAPAALLVVMSPAQRAEVKAQLDKIQGDTEQAGLERAKVFYRHRLWYDTLMAYNALIAKYPQDAKLYKLRAHLYEQLPATRKLAMAEMHHGQ